jgi:hypothetical protein
VTVTDLGPGVTATRIGIAASGGTRPVTASLADGLTLAVITGAPLAVDDPVMDRLAFGPPRAVRITHQRIPQLPGLLGVEMDLQAELADQHRGTIAGCVGSDPWRCR